MARSKTPSRKTREAKATESQELEVEEVGDEAPAVNPAGLEQALVFVTTLALVTAFVLIQLKLRSAFGQGWPF